jgi:hypothetical protein
MRAPPIVKILLFGTLASSLSPILAFAAFETHFSAFLPVLAVAALHTQFFLKGVRSISISWNTSRGVAQ